MRAMLALLCLWALGCSRAPEEPSRPAYEHAESSRGPQRPTRQATCPSDPDGPPELPIHTLVVREKNVQFSCEFVWRPQDTERGLMYRTELADDRGMLFKLPWREQQFWMHNTCISLDMLFLDEDGTILGILERVPPLNDEGRGIGRPSRYVLELAGGASAKFGLAEGQHIELPKAVRDQSVPG